MYPSIASIFVLGVIKLIPVPVLYGVLLNMGLASLETNQIWDRITMFFMQPSKYPVEPFTKDIKPRPQNASLYFDSIIFV